MITTAFEILDEQEIFVTRHRSTGQSDYYAWQVAEATFFISIPNVDKLLAALRSADAAFHYPTPEVSA